jgi:hypothetical protein
LALSRPADGLLVALAFGGLLAQLGCDEQSLNLRGAQSPEALLLSANGKLVTRKHEGFGERSVLS